MIHSTSWRKSSERVVSAQEILNSSSMLEMLAVLELDHPARNRTALRDGFDATYKIGQVDGFQQCLDMLRDLGKPAPLPARQIEPTWGAEVEKK